MKWRDWQNGWKGVICIRLLVAVALERCIGVRMVFICLNGNLLAMIGGFT